MNVFRANCLSVFIAFAVLVGFAGQIFPKCCDDERVPVSSQTVVAGIVQADHGGDGAHPADHRCHCLCHQDFTGETPAVLSMADLARQIALIAPLALTPPQVEPAGIDYPPQLA